MRRISFAWRNSRFSRSSALMRSRSSVVAPGLRPWSRSAWPTQACSVCAVQPILAAIELMAAHCEGCSAPARAPAARRAQALLRRGEDPHRAGRLAWRAVDRRGEPWRCSASDRRPSTAGTTAIERVDLKRSKTSRRGQDRVWNRISDDVRERIIAMALDVPELCPRELATRFTDMICRATSYRKLRYIGCSRPTI